MSEYTPIEIALTTESILETNHHATIQTLLAKSAQAAEAYIDSRINDKKLLLKDLNLTIGAMLIGLGIWQVFAGGGHIPNVFEAVNILHIPGYNEMGQMIVDIDASINIAGGIGITSRSLDSYKSKSPQAGKVDFYLVKAYAMDYLDKLGIRRQHNG